MRNLHICFLCLKLLYYVQFKFGFSALYPLLKSVSLSCSGFLTHTTNNTQQGYSNIQVLVHSRDTQICRYLYTAGILKYTGTSTQRHTQIYKY